MNDAPPTDRARDCHYCGAANPVERETCERCGMALPESRPTRERRLQRRFVIAFVAVVLFCAVMIWYLPR